VPSTTPFVIVLTVTVVEPPVRDVPVAVRLLKLARVPNVTVAVRVSVDTEMLTVTVPDTTPVMAVARSASATL
jgi:hypothetical protein